MISPEEEVHVEVKMLRGHCDLGSVCSVVMGEELRWT